MKTGASGGMRLHTDKVLKIARAVASRHEPTSEELRVARHMAQDGASIAEIQIALGWTNIHKNSVYEKLRKFNIKSRRHRRQHHGLPVTDSQGSIVNQLSFRPRPIRPRSK